MRSSFQSFTLVTLVTLCGLESLPAHAQEQAQDPCLAVREQEMKIHTAFDEAAQTSPNVGEPASDYARRIVSKFVEIAALDLKNSALQDETIYTDLLRCFIETTDPSESSFARSTSSNSSNPQATNPLERSGFTDLVSLALDGLSGILDGQNAVAADDNSITVNLSALALSKSGKEAFSSPAAFREASPWRRVGGSFTFGAELPKKEIVGFSGLPDADELFDAVLWDLKVRVFGDRDPRGKRWTPLLARMAVLVHATAVAATLEPPPSSALRAPELMEALEEVINNELERQKDVLRQSWQVTLKTSGQHLQGMGGADKYSFTLLADRGISAWDLTLNATYSRSDAQADDGGSDGGAAGTELAAVSGGEEIESIENLELNLGLTRSLMRGLLVKDRDAEVSLSGNLVLPLDEKLGSAMAGMIDSALEDRSDVWKVSLTLTLPFGVSGEIPLSLTYANDPNSLAEQEFVEGRIGISWDFRSITEELKKLKASK